MPTIVEGETLPARATGDGYPVVPMRRIGLDVVDGQPIVKRGPIVAGVAIVAVFFGGLVGWAATAELSSASLAPGMVSVEGAHKQVQHFEGGIVDRIHVRDGDRVGAGDVLLELQGTKARTELELLERRLMLAQVRTARLRAERDGLSGVQFPDALIASPASRSSSNPLAIATREAIREQEQLFADRLFRHRGKLTRSESRIAQLGRVERALAAEHAGRKRQHRLLRAELAELRTLHKRGLVTRDKVYDLEQRESELESARSSDLAGLASTAEKIEEIRLEMEELDDDRTNRAAEELQRVQDDLIELRQHIQTATDVLSRTRVLAATGGTVINSKVNTVGGVIMPGEPLMSIVPDSARLLVEAKVRNVDRDVVAVGLPAEIRFTAFNRRNTLPVRGEVLSVSADSMVDSPAEEPFYLARIGFVNASAAVLDGAGIFPGMQADVTIVTGNKTPLDYLVEPLTRRLSRAMRDE